MAFTSAGTKDIEIVDAYPCEARFTKDDPGVCDIALEVKTDSGEDGVNSRLIVTLPADGEMAMASVNRTSAPSRSPRVRAPSSRRAKPKL